MSKLLKSDWNYEIYKINMMSNILFTKIVSFRHNSDAAAVVFVNLDIKKATLKSLESIFTEFLV